MPPLSQHHKLAEHAEHADRPRPPRRLAKLAFSLLSLLIAAGCTSNPITAPPPTIAPAGPAVSPPLSHSPAGTIRPLGGRPTAATFDAGTSALVVLSPGGDPQAPATVTVFGAGLAGRHGPGRAIALPAAATALAGDGRGSACLSARGGYFVVDLATGRIRRVGVNGATDTEFTAIARRTDGTMVLGNADGAVYALAPDPAPETASEVAIATRAKISGRIDSMVTQGNTAVVLDRGQTLVTTVGPDGKPAYALRAGRGATTLAAGPHGPVLAADTRGGQLLVYGVDPLMLRQAYPVAGAPYGLAGSGKLAWVSQTGTNTVIGFDLATGIPVEKVRYPTVRQPNALAFDDVSGTLYVVSGVGDGVQVIEHAAGPR